MWWSCSLWRTNISNPRSRRIFRRIRTLTLLWRLSKHKTETFPLLKIFSEHPFISKLLGSQSKLYNLLITLATTNRYLFSNFQCQSFFKIGAQYSSELASSGTNLASSFNLVTYSVTVFSNYFSRKNSCLFLSLWNQV